MRASGRTGWRPIPELSSPPASRATQADRDGAAMGKIPRDWSGEPWCVLPPASDPFLDGEPRCWLGSGHRVAPILLPPVDASAGRLDAGRPETDAAGARSSRDMPSQGAPVGLSVPAPVEPPSP